MMEVSGWEKYRFNNIEFIYNGHSKSFFNYAFCEEGVSTKDVAEVLDFLSEREWEATWPVDVHMRDLAGILEELKVSHASTPKKAFLNVSNFIEPSNLKDVRGLHLLRVNTNELVAEYDSATSQIFYHNTDIVARSIRGVTESDLDDLQFFLVTIDGERVGTCALYMGSNSVGSYADGVFQQFRGRGIASKVLSEKIKIVQRSGYKYLVAHCMEQSVNLYQRLGFRMLGNLRLYVSG